MRPLGLWFVITGQSFVLPIGDPRDRFFYSTLTVMIDSYMLAVFYTICFLMVPWVGLQSVAEAFPVQNKRTCTLYYLF